MKFTTLVAVLAAAIASVESRPSETNADRLARGLPPLPPARRATPVAAARRDSPSGISNSCNTGSAQCCDSVTTSSSGIVGILESLLGIIVPVGTAVGVTCSPLSLIGIGANSCTAQPVCCENNSFNGLIAIGCSPININL